MVSYEKALEIANANITRLGEGFKIDTAYELEDAYIFDRNLPDENGCYVMYAGGIPFVVTKKKGEIINFNLYMNKYNYVWDDLKPIDFRTGERLPTDIDDEYDE